MPTELSEDQVRALLHSAARTVDVSPGAVATASSRRGRRWVAVAAAAAAVALVLGVVAVTGRGERREVPAEQLAPVPSVLGLTRVDATARLEAAGLQVDPDPVLTCQPDGIALGTRPAASEPQPADGRVVLTYVDPGSATLDCAGLLLGRTWAVVAMLNGGPPVDLADPSVQAEVDAVAAQVGPVLAEPAARVSEGVAECGDVASDDPAFETFRISTATQACGPRVVVERSGRALASIRVGDEAVPTVPTVPDLVGLGEAEARSAAASLVDPDGLYVVYREAGCRASGRVAAQSPRAGGRLRTGDSLGLTVDVVTAGCGEAPGVSAAERELARSLIGLAETDGTGDLADLAGSVQLFVGHAPVGTRTGDGRRGADTWRGCPPGGGYAAFSCPIALLGGLQDDAVNGYETEVVGQATTFGCGGGLAAAGLPADVDDLDSFFLVPPRSESSCAYDYRLQVFVDADGRIAALDLIVSEP